MGLLNNERGVCPVGWMGAFIDVIKEEVRLWLKSLIQKKQ